MVGTNHLYFQSIDLDTTQRKRSIKISKQYLGDLQEKLFVSLVLIIDKEPRAIYLIPSKHLSRSNSNIFVENEISLMPNLSNWAIKVSSTTIPELSMYSLENMIEKLNV